MLFQHQNKIQRSLDPRDTRSPSDTPHQIPPNAESVTEQIQQITGKLVDFMCRSLQDILKEVVARGSPEATIKSLQVFHLQ